MRKIFRILNPLRLVGLMRRKTAKKRLEELSKELQAIDFGASNVDNAFDKRIAAIVDKYITPRF